MRGASALLFFFLTAVLLGCGAGRATTAQRTNPPSNGPPTLALATAIDRAQETIDDPSATPSELQEAGREQQLAFRLLAARRSLRSSTLARLSPGARASAIAALRAADALAKIVPSEHRFPRWRIIAPPPTRRLLDYFRTAGTTYRIPWQYLAAVEFVETRMGRIRGLSPAGAEGPMQFEPATWAEYGRGSIDSQPDSIMAAARFLAANGGRRHIGRALLHYNPSPAYVVAVESYAGEMQRNPRALFGYSEWQVLYRTVTGTFTLPVGYPRLRPERLPSQES